MSCNRTVMRDLHAGCNFALTGAWYWESEVARNGSAIKQAVSFFVKGWSMRLLSLGICSLAAALLLGSAALAADAAKGSLTGKVTDADGKAVTAGTVGVFNPGDLPQPRERKKETAAEGEKPKPRGGRGEAIMEKAVAKGKIGEDGTYKLTDIPAGKYVVLAFSPGNGRARAEVEITAGQESKKDITLKKFAGGRRGGGGDK